MIWEIKCEFQIEILKWYLILTSLRMLQIILILQLHISVHSRLFVLFSSFYNNIQCHFFPILYMLLAFLNCNFNNWIHNTTVTGVY